MALRCFWLFTPSKENQKSERHERNVASHAFENVHVKRCLAMSINIDKKQYPYSTLGVLFPGQDQEGAESSQDEVTSAA